VGGLLNKPKNLKLGRQCTKRPQVEMTGHEADKFSVNAGIRLFVNMPRYFCDLGVLLFFMRVSDSYYGITRRDHAML